jgi:hypothetical protein
MTKDEQIKQILNDFRPERADEFVEKIKEIFLKKPRPDADIIATIELFRPLNDMVDQLFKNTNQRKSATLLLNKLGTEKIKKAVAYINKHKSELYFPLITKPSELVSK